jgi:chromosome segregation ATPase
MSNAMKAAEDIKQFAKKFQHIFSAAAALEEIGSLEQAARDAAIAKDKAYKEVELIKADIQAFKFDFEKAQVRVSEAQEKAAEIEAKAKDKAAYIYAESEKKGQDLIYSAQKQVRVLEGEKANLEQYVRDVQAEILGKKKELQEIVDQIAEMKSKIAAFVK